MNTKVDFRDTATAFAQKSDCDLKMARLLFRGMGSPTLLNLGKFGAYLSTRFGLPIGWALRPTLYKHFVTGETLGDSLPKLRKLYSQGVQGVMDYSAEGGANDEDTLDNFLQNMKAVRFAGQHPEVSHAVFKVSGLGMVPALIKAQERGIESLTPSEMHDYDQAKMRFMELCNEAAKMRIHILVDAEHYAYQRIIDDWTEEAIERFNTAEDAIVFATLQMYRHDRLPYLRKLYELGKKLGVKVGVKFVRGAYMEEERARAAEMGYADPICATKADTDTNYNAALVYTLNHMDVFELFCGTHNEGSVRLLMNLMEEKGLARDDERIYFAQLYGMSDNLSFNLAKAGYRITKYCPYAPVNRVLPYLIRRAEENSSIGGQTGRELTLIEYELDRRDDEKYE